MPAPQTIRCEHALPAIVPAAAGAAAARVRAMRRGLARDAVLAAIRNVHARHGRVSHALLAQVPGMPGARRLCRMFGSLAAACALAGIAAPHLHSCQVADGRRRALTAALCDEVRALAHAAGGCAEQMVASANLLRLNGACTVRVMVVCCRRRQGRWSWRVPLAGGAAADFVLAGLLDTDNAAVGRWALVAVADAPRAELWFGAASVTRPWALLSDSLPALFGLEAP